VTVTSIRTIRLPAEHDELLWVQVETADGLVGIGETMPRPGPVEAVIHDILAPLLIGADPAPEPFWHRAFQAISYHGYAGAELRALSAVDIALWDLLGQRSGQPVYRLLGGPCRTSVPVYNTCVGYGELDDHRRFLADPVGLARELADAGYTGMKIWPFDPLSVRSMGQRITTAEMDQAVGIFAEIHDALGGRMAVALEGHSCWNLPSALLIARELQPYRPMWLEDLLPATTPASWAQLRQATDIPICGSERVFTRWDLAPYLRAGAFDVVKQDLCWTGGFTELTKIAAQAATHDLPLAPHNCHGPIGSMATAHLAAAVPNLFLMETVRSFARGFFDELADGAPVIENATITLSERPGLGVSLRPEVLNRAQIRRSDAAGAQRTGWADGDPWAGDVSARL
jgi:L-alanine-DL-glutamate epimerase-like enolase superfamily enzyme